MCGLAYMKVKIQFCVCEALPEIVDPEHYERWQSMQGEGTEKDDFIALSKGPAGFTDLQDPSTMALRDIEATFALEEFQRRSQSWPADRELSGQFAFAGQKFFPRAGVDFDSEDFRRLGD